MLTKRDFHLPSIVIKSLPQCSADDGGKVVGCSKMIFDIRSLTILPLTGTVDHSSTMVPGSTHSKVSHINYLIRAVWILSKIQYSDCIPPPASQATVPFH